MLDTAIPVLLFIAAHTGTLIWFLAGTKTSLQYLGSQVQELKGELTQLRAADARLILLSAQVEDLSRRLGEMEKSR